jgi:hypothetical protein
MANRKQRAPVDTTGAEDVGPTTSAPAPSTRPVRVVEKATPDTPDEVTVPVVVQDGHTIQLRRKLHRAGAQVDLPTKSAEKQIARGVVRPAGE